MRRISKIIAATAFFTSCLAAQSYGQSFAPPVAYNYDYSGALANTFNINHAANYSIANMLSPFGNTDLYLAGWSGLGGGSEMTYQFAAPGDPTNILYQGTVSYPNGQEIQVGSISINSQGLVLVAYRTTGSTPAYKMDVYKITSSTTAPLSYSTTITLSTSTGGDGRISMDCHNRYGVALVYATAAGIETRVGSTTNGSSLVMSAQIPLSGTANNRSPDVAISHASGLNVHFVYYNPVNYRITESVVDFNTLFTWSGSITPTIEDVNQLPPTTNNFERYVRPVIDCPDHYDAENWAYTYTYNASTLTYVPLHTEGIFVRFKDYHSTAVPTTVNVADGSLGNASCMDYYPVFPTLCYGEGGIGQPTGEIYVAWENQLNPTGDGNMFVGVHMREDGSSLLSGPSDYLTIPNPYNSFAVNAADANNLWDYYMNPIALSKNSDAEISNATNFLYTTYFYNDAAPSFYLNHSFHEWGNNAAYKGSNTAATVLHPECGKPLSIQQVANKIQVQPNPFNDNMRVSFTLPEDGVVHTELSDVLGRVIWQHTETFTKGDHALEADNLLSAAPGIYMLNTSLNGKVIGTKKVVKQQSSGNL